MLLLLLRRENSDGPFPPSTRPLNDSLLSSLLPSVQEPQVPVPEPAVPSTPDTTSAREASGDAPSPGLIDLSTPGDDAGSPSPPAVDDTAAADQPVDAEKGAPTLAAATTAAATVGATATEKGSDEPGADVVDPNGVGGSLPETPGDAPVPGDLDFSSGDVSSKTPFVNRVEGDEDSPAAGHPAAAAAAAAVSGGGDLAASGETDDSLPSVEDKGLPASEVDDSPATDIDDVVVDVGAEMSDSPAAATTKVPDTLPAGGEEIRTGPADADDSSAEMTPGKDAVVEVGSFS